MKNLKNLLAKLENLSEANTDQVTNLNSVIAQKIQGGKVLPTKNGVCDGTNGTCTNDLCQGSTNTTCGNTTCFA